MSTKPNKSLESIRSPGSDFWQGFTKRAEEQEQGDHPLRRTISKAGPVLADLTEESDRGRFPTFRG